MAISRAYARSWSPLRQGIAQQAISQSLEGDGRGRIIGECGLPSGIPVCVSQGQSPMAHVNIIATLLLCHFGVIGVIRVELGIS